jgi:hypothetical protein
MDHNAPSPAEALAEIERTQRARVHPPALAAGGLGITAAVYGLRLNMRVRWKAAPGRS